MKYRTTITFPSKEAKDLFIGGLLDGWGENWCQLDCDDQSFDQMSLVWCEGMALEDE